MEDNVRCMQALQRRAKGIGVRQVMAGLETLLNVKPMAAQANALSLAIADLAKESEQPG